MLGALVWLDVLIYTPQIKHRFKQSISSLAVAMMFLHHGNSVLKTEPLPHFTYAPLLHSTYCEDVKQIHQWASPGTHPGHILITCFVIFWSMCSQCSSKNFDAPHSSLQQSLPITSPAAANLLTLNLGHFSQTFPHFSSEKTRSKSPTPTNRISLSLEKKYTVYQWISMQHVKQSNIWES